MASLTTENIVRNYLKEKVTSKDEILDMLCEKMDDLVEIRMCTQIKL